MEDDMRRIAIFDFCETLVSFQTADAYLKYVLQKEEIEEPALSGLSVLFNKLCFRVFNVGWNKHIFLKKLKGIKESSLEQYAFQFYYEKIKTALIKESVDLLVKLKKEGYYIVIASAGFGIYIKYFANDMNVDQYICSEIEFKNEKATGKLSGYDLIRRKKTRKLRSVFHMNSLRNCESVAVSDSKSDLPLLNYCKKAIVVCKKKPRWLKKGMEVLIWN